MSKKYANPPIVEAVCEFRFEKSSPWDLTIPGIAYEKLKDSFPNREQGKSIGMFLKTSGFGMSERMKFFNEDRTAAVQIGEHLLVINHLKPYPGWIEYRALIEKALGVYMESAKLSKISRISLRASNLIALPGDRVELKDYFEFYPEIGNTLPQDYTAFVVGGNIPFDDGRDSLKMQLSGPDNAEDSGGLSVWLELDYFLGREGEIEHSHIFDWLEQAHNRLVTTFEGCIKDSLRQSFGEVGESKWES